MRVSYPGQQIVLFYPRTGERSVPYEGGRPMLLPTDALTDDEEELEGQTLFDYLEILSIEMDNPSGWYRVLLAEPIEGITTFYMPKDGLQLRPSIAFEGEHVEPFVYKDETGKIFNGYRVKNGGLPTKSAS
jgi:hypothetical protein